MKKILLSIFTMTTLGMSAQNVNIPDANFKAYLLGNTLLNTNNDNEIQYSEASTFNYGMNCSNLNISDLTGIEAFTSLTNLTCKSNSLTTLDLTNNVNLEQLTCTFNNLTTLNVTGLTNLNLIWCFANSLTSLDLSTNTALAQVQCRNNLFNSLDFSSNTNLNYLNCANNPLTALNLKNGTNVSTLSPIETTNCPNLTCIQVDDVTYSTTNWTSIDATASFSTNCPSVGVGINESTQNLDVNTYPNPTTGKVTFSSTDISTSLNDRIKMIEIYNLTGQKVASFNNTNTIDISQLSNGIYTAKVLTGIGVITKKIIKE